MDKRTEGERERETPLFLSLAMTKVFWLGRGARHWRQYLSPPPILSRVIPPFSACPEAMWNETPCNQTTALLLKLSQTLRLFDVCVSDYHMRFPLPPACTERALHPRRQGRPEEIYIHIFPACQYSGPLEEAQLWSQKTMRGPSISSKEINTKGSDRHSLTDKNTTVTDEVDLPDIKGGVWGRENKQQRERASWASSPLGQRQRQQSASHHCDRRTCQDFPLWSLIILTHRDNGTVYIAFPVWSLPLFISSHPPSIPKDPKLANTRAKKEMARRKKIGKREIEEGREPLFDVFACIKETKASNCKWAN